MEKGGGEEREIPDGVAISSVTSMSGQLLARTCDAVERTVHEIVRVIARVQSILKCNILI